MRRILRWLGHGLGVLAALLLLALAGATGLVWLTLPATPSAMALPGLGAAVEVRFDPRGIPHIRAETETDGWRALGLLHARERLAQMDLTRRGATGRLAEIAGPGALRLDRYMRLLDLERRAEADLALLPADARAALDAYAEGVNAWIARRGRFAAPEFLVLGAPVPWRPVDSLLWGRVMSLWLSGSWQADLARLRLAAILPPDRLAELWPDDATPGRPDRPDLTTGSTAAAPPVRAANHGQDGGRLTRIVAQSPRFPEDAPQPSTASNAWAVAPWRSTSGGALLATDPHLGYGAPILWYLARIELPGGHFLAGATAPGVPGVLFGRNERLAWGVTATHADAQDVVIERLAGPDAQETPEGPLPFTRRETTIRQRGAAPVTLTLRESRHGPIVSDLDPAPESGATTVLALALAALAPGDMSAAGLLALNRAGSIAEAQAAAALIAVPQNLIVADTAGSIALYVTGRIPIRRVGDGTLPQPGWEGPAWTGFQPFDALPHVVDPPSGMIANANNRVAPPGHPVFLTRDWPGDWRFRRIGQRLVAQERHDAAGFAAMQADTLSLFAVDALRAFQALPRPEDGPTGLVLDRLLAWDGDMAADRPEPLILHATLRRFGRAAFANQAVPPDAGRVSAEFLAHLLHPDGRGAPWCGGAGCPAMLGQALRETTAVLAAEQGPDPAAWRWGPAHVARFEHPLLRHVPGLARLTSLSAPTAGDGETLLRAAFRSDGPGFANIHGAGFRGVFDLGTPAGAFGILATGQSGHPLSPHFGDQLPPWLEGRVLRLGPLPGEAAPRMRLDPGH